jgi:hypothetical protein
MLTGAVAVAVTVGAITWTWRTQWSPRPMHELLHRGVGERLAEEIVQVLGPKGRLVVITLLPGTSPVLDAQETAFRERLNRWPELKVVRTDEVASEKGDKYGPGTGLSARRFLRLAEKESDADLIVSFIGTPDPEDLPEAKGSPMGAPGPRLVAISRSPKELVDLIERGLLVRALVPRFHYPAPGPAVPGTAAEWFESRFQVVTPEALGGNFTTENTERGRDPQINAH